MVIFIDIDETICNNTPDRNYANAEPIQEHIDRANELYDQGHTIVYWTARGATTGIDWRPTTEEQFKRWGVKYHDLRLDKPYFDVFIDDKNINSKDFLKNKF